MQSVLSQENMIASPMQGVQGTAYMFSTMFPSQKRAADGAIGVFGDETAQGVSKRPRLNVSIHSMQTDSQSAQTSPHTLQGDMNPTMTPLESTGINPAFQAAVPISRSNSMAIPGHQTAPMDIYSPHMQDSSFSQQHPFRTPSVISMNPGYDLQRHGSFSASNQNMPFTVTPYDHQVSSMTSSVGFPPSVNPYGVKGAPEGFSPFHPLHQPLPTPMVQHGHLNDGRFTLVVKQQPERARLCSFKEENDTSMLSESGFRSHLTDKTFAQSRSQTSRSSSDHPDNTSERRLYRVSYIRRSDMRDLRADGLLPNKFSEKCWSATIFS